jgi:aryl-alcohol dehydrogenase-like predicted oxidoreductase
MEKRLIGSLEVSLVGLGCNNFGRRLDVRRTREVIDAAIDAGIVFLDTADLYGATQSEEFMGVALAGRREQVVLATKFGGELPSGERGAAPSYVKRALEHSLRRLQTDYVDLYQLHTPDPATPIADTLGALGELREQGKVREIGCSNFTASQLVAARESAAPGGGFVSVQNEYSLLNRTAEADVLPLCSTDGLAFLPYFPLANGLLTGKYLRDAPAPPGTRLAGLDSERAAQLLSESAFATVERLGAFADAHGHTLLELAISWLAARPAIASVIAGATSVEQVQLNATAATWDLDEAQLREIDQLTAP